MRVLFTTIAAPTHLYTQVPLAWALRSAGHEVRVASQPDIEADIIRAGLTAVPIGEPFDLDQWTAPPGDAAAEESLWSNQGDVPWERLDFCESRPEKLTYEYMHGLFTAWTALDFQYTASAPTIEELVGFCRYWRPDLVIWDPLTFAGPVAAAATGAAHARLMFGFDVLAQMRRAYLSAVARRPPQRREDPFADWLGPVLRRYGREFDEEAVTGQWTIDPVPSSLRLAVDHHYVPVRYVPYNGAAALPDWLLTPPRRRRVCLTLGRSFREVLGGDRVSVAELLDAVADLDIEVVATLNAGQLRSMPRLPANVRAVDFVPLDALLPTCSAIVHHSGSGTSQTALAHGVPQVIVPAPMFDNLMKARQTEAAGAGIYVRDVARLTATGLRDMLIRVLDEPSFAANATRIRREILGTPAPRDIVPILERLTAEHRRRDPA